jgi:hypothetical protein
MLAVIVVSSERSVDGFSGIETYLSSSYGCATTINDF